MSVIGQKLVPVIPRRKAAPVGGEPDDTQWGRHPLQATPMSTGEESMIDQPAFFPAPEDALFRLPVERSRFSRPGCT